MTEFYAVLAGVLGLVIGSFLNVVIYRVPVGESIVTPGSHCPKCGHHLRAWELIPVLSYLILGGRCGKCRTRISWRYPAIELLTGVLFVLTFLSRPERSVPGHLFDLAFVALLVVLTFIDIDHYRLPDSIVLVVAGVGLVNTFVTGEPDVWHSLGGAAGIGGIFLLIACFYPKGMGLGDVKFVAALGLYLGAPEVFLAVFAASLLGVILGSFIMLISKKGLKDPIPFGPFLAGGAFLLLLFQDALVNVLRFYYL